jgi:hypothetical protein
MLISNDFAVDDLDSTAREEGAAPAVLVVRKPGRHPLARLLSPFLIIALAILVLVWRMQLGDWSGLAALDAKTLAGVFRVPVHTSPRARQIDTSRRASRPPRVKRAADAAEPLRPVAPGAGLIVLAEELALSGPVPDISLRRTRIRTPVAIGFDPPAAARAGDSRAPELALSEPDPRSPNDDPLARPRALAALTKEVLAAIGTEAKRVRAERARLDEIKAREPEEDRRRARMLRAQKLERARREADASRGPFLEDLVQILERSHGRAATGIQLLIEDNLVEIDQAVSDRLATALTRNAGRLDRNKRIALFRSHGIPESLILEYLWKQQIKMIPARNGPRDEADALVRASQQLLAARSDISRVTAVSSGPRSSVSPGRNRGRSAQ